MNLEQLKSQIAETRYEITNAKKDLGELTLCKEKLEANTIPNLNEAIQILTTVLAITQDEILGFIEEIVTDALQYVYGEEYSFKIKFEIKRNQPEIRMFPVKGGLEYDPKFSCGGGVIDICSFALRFALWALLEPQPASVMLMDETFRNVHGIVENEKLAMMVKHLSDLLGIQVIMVSGETVLSEYADRVFNVKLENGISKVETIK